MLHGTDYQRYKQKLERLQSKVKRSEGARKELEMKFQRLMKERNECEKAASIHKSKYDFMLEQERKRMSRNAELLHMLEEVDAKATALASKTERLKMLKSQQELILINSWKQNIQQQLILTDVPPMRAGMPLHHYSTPIEYAARQVFDSAAIANENIRARLVCEPVTPLHIANQQLSTPILPNRVSRHLMDDHVNDVIRSQVPNNEPKYQSSLVPTAYPLKSQIAFSLAQYNQGAALPSAINASIPRHQYPLQQFATLNYQYQPHMQQQPVHAYGGSAPPIYDLKSNNPNAELTNNALSVDRGVASNVKPATESIINPNSAFDGVNHNGASMSSALSKTNYLTSILPVQKLPENELQMSAHQQQQSNADKSAFNFNDSHTYSSIKNSNQPPIHYEGRRAQFSFATDEATNPQTMHTSAPKTNLPSELLETVRPIADMAKATTAIATTVEGMEGIGIATTAQYGQQQQIQQHKPSTNSFDVDTIDRYKRTECVNEPMLQKGPNSHIGDIGNIYNQTQRYGINSDEQWTKRSDNDGYVGAKQLADCKISEMRPDYASQKIGNDSSSASASAAAAAAIAAADVHDFSIATSTAKNMNDANARPLPTPYYEEAQMQQFARHEEASKKDNYQYNDDVYGNQHPHDSIKAGIKMAHNRLHITNDMTPPNGSAIKSEERRRMSIDSLTLARGSSSIDADNDIANDTENNNEHKKSIAANETNRRYSVAALNNLPQNFRNVEPFFVSPANTDSQGASRVSRTDINRNKYDNDYLNMFGDGRDNDSTKPIENIKANPSTAHHAIGFEAFVNEDKTISNDQNVATDMASSYLPAEKTNITNMTAATYFGEPSTAEQIENAAIVPNDFADKSHLRYENDSQVLELNGTTSNDRQTFLENRMENLQLTDGTEITQLKHEISAFNPSQEENGAFEKPLAPTSHHGKRNVTWADDPDNSYKRDGLTEFYDANQNEIAANADGLQQQLQQQISVGDSTSIESYQSGGEHLIDEYPPDQSDSINLTTQNNTMSNTQNAQPDEQSNANSYYYDDSVYQTDANNANQNIYPDQTYYYPDDNNQYAIDQQQTEQQQNQYEEYQEQPQQEGAIQYYDDQQATNFADDGSTVNYSSDQPTDGYYVDYAQDQTAQPYAMDSSSLQAPQTQTDEYYTVSPGENYYTDYTVEQQNPNYLSSDIEESSGNIAANAAQMEAQQPMPNTANIEQTYVDRVPNYLQSDTDESQAAYGNEQINPNQDSDFDFSTNS